MEFAEGNSQDARTLVEFSGVSIKVVGARLGPKRVSTASAKMHYHDKTGYNCLQS